MGRLFRKNFGDKSPSRETPEEYRERRIKQFRSRLHNGGRIKSVISKTAKETSEAVSALRKGVKEIKESREIQQGIKAEKEKVKLERDIEILKRKNEILRLKKQKASLQGKSRTTKVIEGLSKIQKQLSRFEE